MIRFIYLHSFYEVGKLFYVFTAFCILGNILLGALLPTAADFVVAFI